MQTFKITNTISGADLGTYQGATSADALDAMARDAGYADYAECCADVPAAPGELRVTDIGPAACSSCGSYASEPDSTLCTACGVAHKAGEPAATAYAVPVMHWHNGKYSVT